MSEQIPDETRNAIRRAVSRGLSAWSMPAPVSVAEWAKKNFYIVASRKGKSEGRFRPYHYQIGLLDLIGNDDVKVITIQKASRLGVSLVLEAAIAYTLAYAKRSVALFCDTDDERDQTVKDQYQPIFDQMPVLKEARVGQSTLAKSAFVGGSFHARGGNSQRAYQRISVDMVVYEELDRFPDNVGGSNKGVAKKRTSTADRGEGSPTDLGDTRTTQSAFAKSIRNSSPSVKGLSKIEQSLSDADVILSYHVPCPHCEDLQLLEWGGPDVDYGLKWETEDGKPHNVRYLCRNCSEPFDYGEMLDQLPGGRWQTDDGQVWLGPKARFYRDDKEIPAPEHVGILQDCMISPDISWTDDIKQYQRAIGHKKRGDVGPLKTWTNTRRARTWEQVPEATVKASEFQSTRCEKYNAYAPAGVKAIFAGADVQIDRIEITIRGIGVGEESWVLEHVIHTGAPQEQHTWDFMQSLLDTEYQTEDGRYLKIQIACIDAGHAGTEVHRFCRRPGNLTRAIPIFGSSHVGTGRALVTPPDRPVAKHKTYLTEVGTDSAKELTFFRLSLEYQDDAEVNPGYVHFPVGMGCSEDYFKQLLESETRIIKWSRGSMVYSYDKRRPDARNEALDTFVYTEAAYEFWRQRMGGNIDRFDGAINKNSEAGAETAASRIGKLAASLNI